MPKNPHKPYKGAFLYLKTLILPHRKWFFIASSMALASAGTGLLNAKVTQWLVDSASKGKMTAVYMNAALFAMVILLNYIITYLSGISVSRLAAAASRDMKRQIAKALADADYGVMLQQKTGDMLSTVNSDTQAVTAFLGGDLIGLLSQAVLAACATVYLLCTSPLLMLMTFAYTPAGMFIALRLNKKMQRLYPLRADRAGEALSVIEQALSQVPVVKSFLRENQLRRQVMSGGRAVLETDLKIAACDAPLQAVCSSTAYIPRILFLVFGGLSVMGGHMTLGSFVAVFDLLTFIIGPSVYLPFMLNALNKAIASTERVRRLAELPPLKAGRPLGQVLEQGVPSLVMDRLSFAYSFKEVIRALSFSYSGTGIIALKGKSGSGKTTLLDLIAGLLVPTDGKIGISGEVASMQQDSFLFDGTVGGNVRMGNTGATAADVEHALKRAGAEGLNTDISCGEGGGSLSGGQRQRVALARTILSNAPVWLLDEPTSAMDDDTERIILQTLEQERHKRLIVVSAHRQTLLDMADAVVCLDKEGGETQ